MSDIKYDTEIDKRCFQKNTINVLTTSGGKDSLATSLLAKNAGVNHINVFADTGHEHAVTYDYIQYLSKTIGNIQQVKADLSKDIERKRKYITDHWYSKLIQKYHFSEERSAIHHFLIIV